MAASEVDAIKTIDNTLSALADAAACERLLRWAWAKFVPSGVPPTLEVVSPSPQPRTKAGRRGKGRKANSDDTTKNRSGSRKPRTISMVRDLNLRPKGKKSFADFVSEKQPSSNFEKCAVAVYYLKNEIAAGEVTVSHVLTCFKEAHWRVPANLSNTLSLTAFRKGWVDTRGMDNISVTTHGENLIEHDLPRKEEA